MAVFPYLNTMIIVKPVHVVCTTYYLKIFKKMLSTLKKNYTSLFNSLYFFLSRISFEKYFSSFIIGKDLTSLFKQENYPKSLQDL